MDLEAKIVICTAETRKVVFKAVQNAEMILPHKIKLFSFGRTQNSENNCENVIELLEKVNDDESPIPVNLTDSELDKETAIIFWTSGTTGITSDKLLLSLC